MVTNAPAHRHIVYPSHRRQFFPSPLVGEGQGGGDYPKSGGCYHKSGGCLQDLPFPYDAPMVSARALRKNPTDAEWRLWTCLRHKQVDGFRFRRQAPIGPYWLISSVSPPGWWWKSTAVNMRSVRIRMPGARDGWRMKGSASSGSGTRRSSGTPKAWPRRSGGHSGTFPHPGDYLPPPRPSPTRGEGGRHSPRPEKSYGVVLPALNSATASSAQRSSWSWVAAIASSQRDSSSRISS